jgi:hypothetical protein
MGADIGRLLLLMSPQSGLMNAATERGAATWITAPAKIRRWGAVERSALTSGDQREARRMTYDRLRQVPRGAAEEPS